jgi:hypothetical protein
MMQPSDSLAPAGEFVMFACHDGKVCIESRFESETLWLPQGMMASLYQISPQAITQHIKAIYEEGELEKGATCKSFLQVQAEGQRTVHRISSICDSVVRINPNR